MKLSTIDPMAKTTDITLFVGGEKMDAGKMLLVANPHIRGLFIEATIRGFHHFRLSALCEPGEDEYCLFDVTASPVEATGAALLEGYRSYIPA